MDNRAKDLSEKEPNLKNKYSAQYLENYLKSHPRDSLLEKFMSYPVQSNGKLSSVQKNTSPNYSIETEQQSAQNQSPRCLRMNKKGTKLLTECSDSPNQLAHSNTRQTIAIARHDERTYFEGHTNTENKPQNMFHQLSPSSH